MGPAAARSGGMLPRAPESNPVEGMLPLEHPNQAVPAPMPNTDLPLPPSTNGVLWRSNRRRVVLPAITLARTSRRGMSPSSPRWRQSFKPSSSPLPRPNGRP